MAIFTASIGPNSQVDNMWFTIKYIVVATLFLLLLWLLSRWLIQKKGHVQTGFIKVHQTTPFVGGKLLSVIEIEGVFYIVATDKNNITLIDKRDNLEIPNAPSLVQGIDFNDVLGQFLKKHKKNEGNKDVGKDQ